MIEQPPVVQPPVVRPQRMEQPPHPRLARMRVLSRLLDNSIPLPGGYRIGLDPIIGLIPIAGDFLTSTMSVYLIYEAARMGLRKRVLARMAGNVILESLVGTAPVLGDLFDAVWKANARNMRLVENHYSPAHPERTLAGLAAAFILGLLAFWALMIGAIYLMVQFIASLFAKFV